jgi:anion-transporting  ArsA/GET3 family ATPase
MNIFAAKVHFIAGKGGVGRTTVAVALSQYFASLGLKTLRVDLSDNADQKPGGMTADAANLTHMAVAPKDAIQEYLALKIGHKKILDMFYSHSLFNALCEAAPGLSDLTRLGKIWFHADPCNESRAPIFDRVVVDMPSSGFVARFLSVAHLVQEAVKIGPMAKEAGMINDFLLKPENALVHVVALPQELVVNESLELAGELIKKSPVKMGAVWINRAFKEDPKALEKLAASVPEALKSWVADQAARAQSEEYEVARIKSAYPKIDVIAVGDYADECPEKFILNDIIAAAGSSHEN